MFFISKTHISKNQLGNNLQADWEELEVHMLTFNYFFSYKVDKQ